MTSTLPTDSVRFVKELYPRLKPSDEVVDRYIDAIDNLPPIVVARDGVLVDGFHRWQAHIRTGRPEIAVEHLGDLTDAEILRESYIRNATHGHQLSTADKKRAADHLYRALPRPDGKDDRVDEIARLLGLTVESARRYVATARQDEKREAQERAWDMWLDCHTQQAIADATGIPQPSINRWLSEMERRSDLDKPPGSLQHFDIWQFATSDNDASYFGAMPPQVVENLLWLYTNPGDIVFDPFVGSGTTITVAKSMGRRVYGSDRASASRYPHLPIRSHDITTGWPDDAPSKVRLTLLDPPYWQQAKGRYSTDPDDLGNMTINDFMVAWEKVAKVCSDRSEVVAFIVSPTQMDDGNVIDHAFDMASTFTDMGRRIVRRVIVPYSTQQATGQQVTWARDGKRLLKLYRDLVVIGPAT